MMRALLVLYMVIVLKFGEAFGTSRYADYYGLIELGAVLGALFADRLLGLKRAILLGGWFMGSGHLLLALDYSFVGLALVVVGSSLFAANIIQLSENGQKGPTSIYLLLNAGGFIVTPFCALFAQHGWHIGFWIAAGGTLIANVLLHRFGSFPETPRRVSLSKAALFISAAIVVVAIGMVRTDLSLALLPWIELAVFGYIAYCLLNEGILTIKQLSALGIYLVGLTLFYTIEEQVGNSAYALADEIQASRGLTLAPTLIAAMNPLMILLFEGPIDGVCRKRKQPWLRVALPFAIGSICFLLLSLGGNSLWMAGLVASSITLGELIIGSAVYDTCIEISHRGKSKAIGLVSIVFALATSVGSRFCKTAAHGFTFQAHDLALLLAAVGIVLSVGLLILHLNKMPAILYNTLHRR